MEDVGATLEIMMGPVEQDSTKANSPGQQSSLSIWARTSCHTTYKLQEEDEIQTGELIYIII